MPASPSNHGVVMDETLWRVGSHYDIHIYNALGVPIATAMTAEAAQQIVEEHNHIREIANNPKAKNSEAE
jgi:hypothetical protein